MPPVLDPKSPQAGGISDLLIITLAIAFGIVLLISVLVAVAVIKFRRKPDDEGEPRQVSGSFRLEVAWTLAPAVILIVLLIMTIGALGKVDPPIENRQPDLEIVGKQWWWEFRVPSRGIVTANEIHIPTGKPIMIKILAGDVIHDFWVPQLGRKMDAIPGHVNQTWIQADTPGIYYGACAEYCGDQHAWMNIRVVADEPAKYEEWAAAQKRNPAVPTAGDAARGWDVFKNRTCINCHAINGTEAQSKVGPNLTYVASRATLGAGIIPNSRENLYKWLDNPQAIKPGVKMPSLKLSDQELRDLIAYFEELAK